MNLSIILARIISAIYLSAAVGTLLDKDQYRRVADDMFKNAAITYLMGFTAAIVGLLIVNYHNVWTHDWPILITILGWLATIKGVFILAVPGLVERFSKLVFGGRMFKLFPYVAVCLGLLFGYFGFVR